MHFCPAFHQLQYGRWLVLDDLAHHHRQLECTSGEKWLVPIGGGFGRVFRIDHQAFNASIQAYYNVVRPDDAADWNLRISLALLFPK